MANTATLVLTLKIRVLDTKRLTTMTRRPDITPSWLTMVHTLPNTESMTDKPTTTKVLMLKPDMTDMEPMTDTELKPTVFVLMTVLPTDTTTADTVRATSMDPHTNTKQLSDQMTRPHKRPFFCSSIP
ncbi:hypothetical protein X975_08096, partial [Stegodyphus mimosarum]